jgi:GrpB-like predicted nucleotidyltransferase (UPF0157 family)
MWPPHTARHHLYVVVEGSKPHVDHIRFRDYLPDHPEVARRYAELKRALAEQHRDDREAYAEAKAEFISRGSRHYERLSVRRGYGKAAPPLRRW